MAMSNLAKESESLEFLRTVSPDGETRWTGQGFSTGAREPGVLRLCQDDESEGWSDDLTTLHESTAGSDHFIDVASRNHTIEQLKRWTPVREGTSARVMEIGCSSGFFVRALRDSFPAWTVVASDVVLGPLERLHRAHPEIPAVQFDLSACPLPSESMDALVLLNVLEHIEDDDSAMQEAFRLLAPGGVAVIELPAGPQLFDYYDRHLCHYRRYAMPDLTARLERHGFEIVSKSHLGALLYPAFWLTKKMHRVRPAPTEAEMADRVAEDIESSGRASGLGSLLMGLEARLRRWVYLPLGIRCLVTCRRPW